MPRRRQARRCRARRTNGEPCKAYAITGGFVCAAHGGSAPQVRHEARVRQFETTMNIAFDKAHRRWQSEVQDWQVGRVLAAAVLFGISPEKVTPGDILVGVIEGVIPGESTMPTIRVDRRYGPRTGQRKERNTTATQASGPAERRIRDAFAAAAEAWENE
jgi:hypothetical protein